MRMRIYYQVMDYGFLEIYHDVIRLKIVLCPRLREVEPTEHGKIPSILIDGVFTLSEHARFAHCGSHVVNNRQQSS